MSEEASGHLHTFQEPFFNRGCRTQVVLRLTKPLGCAYGFNQGQFSLISKIPRTELKDERELSRRFGNENKNSATRTRTIASRCDNDHLCASARPWKCAPVWAPGAAVDCTAEREDSGGST